MGAYATLYVSRAKAMERLAEYRFSGAGVGVIR